MAIQLLPNWPAYRSLGPSKSFVKPKSKPKKALNTSKLQHCFSKEQAVTLARENNAIQRSRLRRNRHKKLRKIQELLRNLWNHKVIKQRNIEKAREKSAIEAIFIKWWIEQKEIEFKIKRSNL